MAKAVVILGAGGQSKLAADAFLSAGRETAGFLDPAPPAGREVIYGLRVLGGDELLDDPAFVARYAFHPSMGDNALRIRLGEAILARGGELASAVHSTAIISPSAKIGRGAEIIAGVVVNADAVIGDYAMITTSASVDHDCRVGRGARMGPGSRLAGGVIVGDEVVIGTGAIILPNLRIGERAVVGAGAVVTRDVPAGVTVVGVPARPLKR